MLRLRPYVLEYALIAATVLVSVLGFWEIYFGEKAEPNAFHHLHVATNAIWIGLLLYQLRLIGSNRFGDHRRAGLAILGIAPLLVATTALLSVRSALKGITTGEGDFLIIQNVGVTLEVALLVFLAFVLRKRRKLHGALLLSTCLMFMGIALFFTLISFAPQFRIEGPETFHRFGEAAMTGQAICLAVALAFVIKDWRNGWPLMLAAVFFLLNEVGRSSLDKNELIEPLTAFVASLNQPLTFVGTFVLFSGLLVATGVLRGRKSE
jgi:hypothetical protein